MKCSICGFNEDVLLKQKEETIHQIDTEINKLTLEKNNQIVRWKQENGFSDARRDQLNQISKNLTEITIQAFLDNVSSFIKLDARLQIVQDYCDKFGITQKTSLNRTAFHSSNQNRFNKPNISADTIATIIERINQEPLPERLQKENRALEAELQMHKKAKDDLKNIKTFFKEKVYSSDIFEFSHSINTSLKRLYERTHKHIFPSYSIVLCPTCSALFKEAASASFALEQAKREAEDWDDDD